MQNISQPQQPGIDSGQIYDNHSEKSDKGINQNITCTDQPIHQ